MGFKRFLKRLLPHTRPREENNRARVSQLNQLRAQFEENKQKINDYYDSEKKRIEEARKSMHEASKELAAIEEKRKQELKDLDFIEGAILACAEGINLEPLHKIIDLLDKDQHSIVARTFLQINPVGIALIFDQDAACKLILDKYYFLNHII